MLKKIKGSNGATAIEYALIASLIAVVAITGLRLVGNVVGQRFNMLANEVLWNTE
ncbi:MAG: Flp family type IVb pilin [Holosporaceae bacterium]|jgi:Flp pilus assembly pilin Flp|nr:Flp family type IVb pilin [Holosporaceae bacterium]